MRYAAPACPACGSAPLLDSRSPRSNWFCPRCTRYWDSELRQVPYPVYGSEPLRGRVAGDSTREPSMSTLPRSGSAAGRPVPLVEPGR